MKNLPQFNFKLKKIENFQNIGRIFIKFILKLEKLKISRIVRNIFKKFQCKLCPTFENFTTYLFEFSGFHFSFHDLLNKTLLSFKILI